MLDAENVAKQVIQNAKDIAAVTESAKSAHKRLDENDRNTAGIHELAKSVAMIAAEIKALTLKLDESVERIEGGQKAQGERIGKIEQAIASINRNEKTIDDHEKRLDAIEKEPATIWKNLKWLIIAGIATAILGAVITRFIGG